MIMKARIPATISLILVILTFYSYFTEALAANSGNTVRVSIREVSTTSQPKIVMTLSATNSKGLPVTDLSADDFIVKENGKEQSDIAVYPFYQNPDPIDVVLALDTSASMNDDAFTAAQDAAYGLINGLSPEDKVGLITFDKTARVIEPLTQDHARVQESIQKLSRSVGTALYQGLSLAAQEVAKGQNTKAIVLMTDGFNTSRNTTLEEAVAKAQEVGASVFTVGFGKKVDTQGLQKIANETGGEYFSAPTNAQLRRVFADISQKLHQEYRLSYTSSTISKEGEKVKVDIYLKSSPSSPIYSFSYSYASRTSETSSIQPIRVGNLPVINPGKPAGEVPPPPVSLPTLGIIAASGILFLVYGVALAQRPSPIQRRLKKLLHEEQQDITPEVSVTKKKTSIVDLIKPLVPLVSVTVVRWIPGKWQRFIVDKLIAAAYPHGIRLAHFITIQVLLGLTGLVLGLLLTHNLILGLVLLAAGVYLPLFWLSREITQRRRRILLQMPDALDLLTISVEAGLGFDAAMLEIVQKWDNDIAREFALVLSEMKLGKSRRDALRSMAERVQLDEMKLLVSSIVQADEIGASIGRTLSIQSEQMRLRRRQRAEELGHKAVIKIIIPMVLFIFPAVFVVLLGPAIPAILNALGNIGK